MLFHTLLTVPIHAPHSYPFFVFFCLFFCEFSFNKHKQIDTRHNNANNVCVNRPGHLHYIHNTCIMYTPIYVHMYVYIILYTFAGCPLYKRGRITWGLLWRFGCHVEKLRRKTALKFLSQQAVILSLSSSLPFSVPVFPCGMLSHNKNPRSQMRIYVQPQGQTQPQSLPHVLDVHCQSAVAFLLCFCTFITKTIWKFLFIQVVMSFRAMQSLN